MVSTFGVREQGFFYATRHGGSQEMSPKSSDFIPSFKDSISGSPVPFYPHKTLEDGDDSPKMSPSELHAWMQIGIKISTFLVLTAPSPWLQLSATKKGLIYAEFLSLFLEEFKFLWAKCMCLFTDLAYCCIPPKQEGFSPQIINISAKGWEGCS